MTSVLVLNASYEPLTTVSPRRAINLILSDKASPLDEGNGVFHSETKTFKIPHVVRINYYVKVPYSTKEAPFTRKGVLMRDNYKCSYCLSRSATTIDHIMPKSRGGANTYENTVACCHKCNSEKANKTLTEIGWTLKVKPTVPNLYYSLLMRVVEDKEAFLSWSEYVFAYQPSLKDRFLQNHPNAAELASA